MAAGKPSATVCPAWLGSSRFSDEGQYQLKLPRISLLPKESLEVTYDYSGGADRSAGYIVSWISSSWASAWFFCRGTAANNQQCKKLTAANKKLTKKLTADPIG